MTPGFLLRHHACAGDHIALQMAEWIREAMVRAEFYDQLDGGFARYSVDTDWVEPHFEKMLYDNALPLRVYLDLRGRPAARGPAGRVGGRRLPSRQLRTSGGWFASAPNADTLDPPTCRPAEGACYALLTPEQLTAALTALVAVMVAVAVTPSSPRASNPIHASSTRGSPTALTHPVERGRLW